MIRREQIADTTLRFKTASDAGVTPFRPDAPARAPLSGNDSRNALGNVDVHDDAPANDGVLAIPVLLMKCVFLWPDSQNIVTRFISKRIFPAFIVSLITGCVGFIVLGESDSGITMLTTFGDIFACFLCLMKLLLLAREGPQLARMRRRLQTDFTAMEDMAQPEASAANARCNKRCRSISLRLMWLYGPLTLSVSCLCIVNAFDPPEQRRTNLNVPKILLVNPVTYFPYLVVSVLTSIVFFFFSVGYDTLFLSLCMHMSCKCEILKVMLRRSGQSTSSLDAKSQVREFLNCIYYYAMFVGKAVTNFAAQDSRLYSFEYWRDDGSDLSYMSPNGPRKEVREKLRSCVLYHNMIIRLRDETEGIFAGVTLIQMAYILVGLGIPGLRLLRESIFKPTDIIFLLFYAAWNFSQLLFYCWFADMLAASSCGVSVAAYAAMRPSEIGDSLKETSVARFGQDASRALVNLDKTAGMTLRLITMRAQKPLYLTAGNFANITLELYLTVIRKSQSIYSYLIRLR